MIKILLTLLFILFPISSNQPFDKGANENLGKANPPIYIAFLWHMHQPIYWPYESIVQTQLQNRYPYSVFDIHNSRKGPYTDWPKNAVQKGITAGLPHFGAQVSFSGSLIENLNNLETNGNNNFLNWKSHWNNIKTKNTTLGNPRIDMVGFGYFHPLMGLIDYSDIRKQIQMHKQILNNNFSGSYSKGIFPPENAFSNRMIPALVDEGIEWVIVDNIHFDRAAVGYPFNTAGNVYEPNKSDILNPDPNDWIQLNGLWAPTKNSAQWGRQPHWVEYVDPSTGIKKKIIAIPADRYMGNEDGRGGFGALNYENVMSQLKSYNTDPSNPILVVLHHDGDNYGGGTDSYYGSNFQNFVNWLQSKPNEFVCTTIQDYIEMFPPDPNDIIHIEDGSWSGADNGDPEFKKWLGDPGSSGYSPDINSWGVITAAKNLVETAEQINPNNPNTINAWRYLLVGESSDYWYWDGSIDGIWDAHPTRAANLAIQAAIQVTGSDLTPPTIFLPQREPYNPGGTEWNINQTNEVKIWTYIYDKSGVNSATLKYRIDNDGINSTSTIDNETYDGGNDVSEWVSIPMIGVSRPSMTTIQPSLKAKEYSASIMGINEKLIDYFVEAVDSIGNPSRSPILHCWIGANSGGGTGGTSVTWSPTIIQAEDSITIKVSNTYQGAKLHWGVNGSGSNWVTPNQIYWPNGSVLFNNSGPAIESPFIGPDSSGNLTIAIGPFNNSIQTVDKISFVIHFNDNTWNNNNGQDFHITIGGGSSQTFIMDGTLDASAVRVATNQNVDLFLGWNSSQLYLATQSAQSQGRDVFVFITDSLKPLKNAPWAKSGMVTGWNTYLANESNNNFANWFENNGIVTKAVGNILEGTINVQSEFGYIPSKIYLAIGQYSTEDNGDLLLQVPIGNNNGDIESNEFYQFDYTLPVSAKNELAPKNYFLKQNYPNPFNPSTVISWHIPNQTHVTLSVYDILGNKIADLVDDVREAGYHNVTLNVNNLAEGVNLVSGVYFYRLNAGNYIETKKFMILK